MREREPVSVGAINRSLRGDVGTTIAKEMQKDRDDVPTASERAGRLLER